MKHMRKALSLLLVLAMVVCFAVPAFAADTDTATVTVYVTTGMFTEGGYDPDHGTFLEQEFRDGESLDTHLFNGFEAVPLDGATIAALFDTIRPVYGKEANYSENVNVLDAIICALQANGFDCNGGWDSVNNPNGGYVHSVTPGGIPTGGMTTENINGVKYNKYYGTGWRIAIGQNGVFTAPALYGTSYNIEDGMTIVFDLSDYIIYSK